MFRRLRSHSRLSGLTTNYLAFACASYSHASIYPPGLDVDVFTEFCLMSWRLGLTGLEISTAYPLRSHLPIPSMGMAFLTFLLLYCSYWHSYGLLLQKF